MRCQPLARESRELRREKRRAAEDGLGALQLSTAEKMRIRLQRFHPLS